MGAVPSISFKNSFTSVDERAEEVITSTVFVPQVGGSDVYQTMPEEIA